MKAEIQDHDIKDIAADNKKREQFAIRGKMKRDAKVLRNAARIIADTSESAYLILKAEAKQMDDEIKEIEQAMA